MCDFHSVKSLVFQEEGKYCQWNEISMFDSGQ